MFTAVGIGIFALIIADVRRQRRERKGRSRRERLRDR